MQFITSLPCARSGVLSPLLAFQRYGVQKGCYCFAPISELLMNNAGFYPQKKKNAACMVEIVKWVVFNLITMIMKIHSLEDSKAFS